MSDQQQPPSKPEPYAPATSASSTPPAPSGAPLSPYNPGTPAAYGGTGSLGKVRSTGTCILLFFVTLGIYGIIWYLMVHTEMKNHSGRGLGGPVALILALFVGIVMPFLTSNEVGELYSAQGKEKPVSVGTGLWYFPGIFILVGPFIWFAKTNGALNDYWKSLGATA